MIPHQSKHYLTSQYSMKSKKRSQAILSVIITLLLLIISGCNLLGITPQHRKTSPAKKPQTESTGKPDAFHIKQKEMATRIADLEAQLKQDRQQYRDRLKDMDRTIALLETNILDLIKSNKNQPEQKERHRQKKQDVNSKSQPIISKKQPATSITSLPKPTLPVSGEIKTPQSSKAVETVSLLKAGRAGNKKVTSKKKPNSRKASIVGIFPKKKEKKKNPDYQAWEDPDLDGPPSPIRLKVVSGAKRRYQQAFKVYSSKNYTESIKLFNDFLVDFPADQDADNSQFWIGQSHFQLGNHLHAERAFRKVLRNYSHGTTRKGYKTPDAALMLGRIYLNRKKKIKARYYFEQVIQKYPNSRSAVKATREIEAMDSF